MVMFKDDQLFIQYGGHFLIVFSGFWLTGAVG